MIRTTTKWMAWVLVLVLLVLPVLAQPPFQESESTAGLDIRAPVAQFVQIDRSVTLHIHVYNRTNGLLITNQTGSCTVHLYNDTGNHVMELDMEGDSNLIDFDLPIGGGNFSHLGTYSYIISCNTSTAGGFVSAPFEVTTDGESGVPTDTTGGLAATLFILASVFGLLAINFLVPNFTKNTIANLILHRSIYVIATYLMMFNSAIISTITSVANLGINNEMFRYMFLYGMLGYILMGYLVFKTLLDVLELWKKIVSDNRNEDAFEEDT